MKRTSIPVILLWLGAFPTFVGGLSGCNTVKGAGQDIKSAGQAIGRKAEQKKHY